MFIRTLLIHNPCSSHYGEIKSVLNNAVSIIKFPFCLPQKILCTADYIVSEEKILSPGQKVERLKILIPDIDVLLVKSNCTIYIADTCIINHV